MTMPPGHRRSATRVGLGVGLRSFLLRTVRAGHWRQGHDVFLSSGSRASRRSSPTLAQSLARSADLSLEPCPTAGAPLPADLGPLPTGTADPCPPTPATSPRCCMSRCSRVPVTARPPAASARDTHGREPGEHLRAVLGLCGAPGRGRDGPALAARPNERAAAAPAAPGLLGPAGARLRSPRDRLQAYQLVLEATDQAVNGQFAVPAGGS